MISNYTRHFPCVLIESIDSINYAHQKLIQMKRDSQHQQPRSLCHTVMIGSYLSVDTYFVLVFSSWTNTTILFNVLYLIFNLFTTHTIK